MPKTSRATAVHPLTVRQLRVTRIVDTTPLLRTITLAGPQLGAFRSSSGFDQPAFRSDGFDDAVHVYLPCPGDTDPVLPVQRDGRLDFGGTPRPLSRYYTVRRFDPGRGEIDLDFVKHGTGIATSWAYRANVGDPIHISGPSASRALPTADWLLVAGDETALPAIARLLDELPDGLPAQVFVEIADPAVRPDLAVPDGVSLTWLPRLGAPAGTTTLLLDAVRDAPWWPGQPYAWIAGETGAAREIRRYLVEERELPKTDVEFTGYWKRAEVVTLADDPTVPDPEKNPEAFEKLHALAELLPPLAIRAAVDLDLPEQITRGATSAVALADRIGADPVALGKLLRYLEAIEIVEQTGPGHYRLSPAGDFLLHEYVVDVLRADGVVARQQLAFHGLAAAVRTGRASYASVTGQDYATLRAEPGFAEKLGESIAEFAPYVIAPLVDSGAVDGFDRVVVHSDGAGTAAQALLARNPTGHVTVAALPASAGWLRADLPSAIPDEAARARVTIVEQSMFEVSPPCDALLYIKSLSQLPDADAAHALRRGVEGQASGVRVLVLEGVLDPAALDEHQAEEDLLNLALYGSGCRTDPEWRAVFAAAGLTVRARRTVGWGYTLYLLST